MVDASLNRAEQRRERRLPLSLQARRPAEDEKRLWTEDLSRCGLRLATSAPLRLGERLRLHLSFPRFLEPIAVDGSVVWNAAVGERGQHACGVRIWSERDQATLGQLLEATAGPRSHHRVLILDPHPPENARQPSTGPDGLYVTQLDGLHCARALRENSAYDTILVDASLRDARGAHILSELLIGDGAPYDGIVVAVARHGGALRLARYLGATATVSQPVDYWRWLATLAHLSARRAKAHHRRVDFV